MTALGRWQEAELLLDELAPQMAQHPNAELRARFALHRSDLLRNASKLEAALMIAEAADSSWCIS